MKHDGWTTAKLVSWFLLSMIAGLLLMPYFHNEYSAPEFPLYQAVIWVVIGITIGIVFWFIMMKYAKNSLLAPFSLSVGYFCAKMAAVFGAKGIAPLVAAFVGGSLLYVWTVVSMRKSWTLTRRLMPLSNVFMVCIMVGIGVMLGEYVPPLAAIIILALLAVYDGIAVWKTKHMQSWAEALCKQRVIPGLAVARKEEEQFALLGGGDVFFIIFVAGSFWKTSPLLAFASLVGMSLSVLVLFLLSKKKTYYPALPFILAAELGVLAAAWVAL